MLFAMDIGNTNIVLGIYESDKLSHSFRVSTDREKTADEYGILINQLFTFRGISMSDIDDVIISSVVPPLMPDIERMCLRYFGKKPMVVGPGVKTGLKVRYENPREVGADRIVNAVAALEAYGGPVFVVDFGTATTFCAVSAECEYLGGVICPGVGISADALFQRTAKLPRVDVAKPTAVIGRNTVQSLQSGLFYGLVGQVDTVIRRMRHELLVDPKVIATGGYAQAMADESGEIDVVDLDLTLKGLYIIYQKNCPV